MGNTDWIADQLLEWAGIKYIGWLCRWILRWKVGLVMAGGITFYPERRILDKARDIAKVLRGVDTAYAFSVRGDKLVNGVANSERHIKKLLLPDPNASSLKNLELSTNREGAFSESIRAVSSAAGNKGIPVRWYPEFIGYSLLIVEPHSDSGWLSVEWVLPYSTEHADRPSITISKKKQPKAFQHFLQTFEKMWDAAKSADSDPSKDTEHKSYAKVSLEGGSYEVQESHNINSVTDNGTRDITFNFTEPLKTEQPIVDIKTASGSIDWRVVEASKESVRIQYENYEPSVVKVIIEE